MENDDRLIEYILGGLSETERERLEEQYFINDEVWEKLRAVENDLIDSYVRGQMPPGRREQFEKYFLASPGKRRRVEFSTAFMDPDMREAAAEEPRRQGKPTGSFWPSWRFAAAAASLILAIAVAFLFLQNSGLHRELVQAHSDMISLQSQVQTLNRQIAKAQQANGLSGTDTTSWFSSDRPTVSLMLMPGLLRNGNNAQEHILPIPAVPAEVVLLLALESDESPQYDVVLRTAEGKEIRHLQGLTSQALHGDKVVAIQLPAQLFKPGDYIATLSGKSTKGGLRSSYTFSVTR